MLYSEEKVEMGLGFVRLGKIVCFQCSLLLVDFVSAVVLRLSEYEIYVFKKFWHFF